MTISVHVGSTTTGSTAAMLWRESIERAFPSWPQSWRETIPRFHCADPWSSRWPDAINPYTVGYARMPPPHLRLRGACGHRPDTTGACPAGAGLPPPSQEQVTRPPTKPPPPLSAPPPPPPPP